MQQVKEDPPPSSVKTTLHSNKAKPTQAALSAWDAVKWMRAVTWKARSLLLASCGAIPMTIGPSFKQKDKTTFEYMA